MSKLSRTSPEETYVLGQTLGLITMVVDWSLWVGSISAAAASDAVRSSMYATRFPGAPKIGGRVGIEAGAR